MGVPHVISTLEEYSATGVGQSLVKVQSQYFGSELRLHHHIHAKATHVRVKLNMHKHEKWSIALGTWESIAIVQHGPNDTNRDSHEYWVVEVGAKFHIEPFTNITLVDCKLVEEDAVRGSRWAKIWRRNTTLVASIGSDFRLRV